MHPLHGEDGVMPKPSSNKEIKPILIRPYRVAVMLDISIRKVYDLIKDGELKSHNPHPGKKGLRVYFASVEEYALKHEIPVDYYRE